MVYSVKIVTSPDSGNGVIVRHYVVGESDSRDGKSKATVSALELHLRLHPDEPILEFTTVEIDPYSGIAMEV